ncbi:glycosyl transferase [Saprospira sp. CCB-QB6]|uniref:tetratricopeptide repeat protein n=1 Tax=Saprospira sp. CCB-QB6 TaxID=3023936 RepID=UPI002349ED76|nr:glycosyl transferase [Saprospira sp. CCB-QB6]WCL80973.1 glycosyl transferase [Saprospira sp. CCB-QB6]
MRTIFLFLFLALSSWLAAQVKLSPQAEKDYKLAQSYFIKADYRAALLEFQEGKKQVEAENKDLFQLQIGNCYLRLKEYPKAEKAFQSLIKKGERLLPSAFQSLSSLYIDQKEAKKLKRLTDKVIKLEGEQIDFLRNYHYLAVLEKDQKAQQKYLEKICALPKATGSDFIQLAQLAERQNEVELAVMAASYGLVREPQSSYKKAAWQILEQQLMGEDWAKHCEIAEKAARENQKPDFGLDFSPLKGAAPSSESLQLVHPLKAAELLQDTSQALYLENPTEQLSELIAIAWLFLGQHTEAKYWQKTSLFEVVYQEFLEKVKDPQKRKLFSHLALVGRAEGLKNLQAKADLMELLKGK